jgi:hypothetical protein
MHEFHVAVSELLTNLSEMQFTFNAGLVIQVRPFSCDTRHHTLWWLESIPVSTIPPVHVETNFTHHVVLSCDRTLTCPTHSLDSSTFTAHAAVLHATLQLHVVDRAAVAVC